MDNTDVAKQPGKEVFKMSKNIDWSNLGFGYIETDKRFVSNYKDGKWDDGALIDDPMITMSECACVLQYAQTVFEGLKAYTTEDGHVVCFRPDLNAARLVDSCKRLEMPTFPEDRFVDAVVKTVEANIDYVPPYGSGATLYIRPYMFGILLDHTLRAVLSLSLSEFLMWTEQLHTEQVISRQVLTMP